MRVKTFDWCDVQQESNRSNGILTDRKSLDRFLEGVTSDKFKILRRWELCVFFRDRFGPNWKRHVKANCGLNPKDFEREFVRFINPLYGFLWIELYALNLGFVSDCEAGLRNWQASVLRRIGENPPDDPDFDPRLRPLIRATKIKLGDRMASAYKTHPDLVPLVHACRRPFDPLTFAPAWLKQFYPGAPDPSKVLRGRRRLGINRTKRLKNLSSFAFKALVAKYIEAELANPK